MTFIFCLQSLAGSHVGEHRQLGTKDFWSGKQQGAGGGGSDINNVDSWLLDRQFFGKQTWLIFIAAYKSN